MRTVVTHQVEDIVPVIRQAMEDERVTQARLAVHMGLSAVQVNRMLRGQANISLEHLFSMLTFLHIDIVLSPPRGL